MQELTRFFSFLGLFGIENVHCAVRPDENPVYDALDYAFAQLRHLLLLFHGKVTEYIVDLSSLGEVVSDSHTDSCVAGSAYGFGNVLQSVMASVASVLPHPEGAERQVDVITNHNQPFFCHRQLLQPVSDCIAAEVHVSGWLEQVDVPALHRQGSYIAISLGRKNSVGCL